MTRTSGWWRGPLAVGLLALAAAAWIERDRLLTAPVAAIAPDSKAAFDLWLAEEPERQARFADFEAYLAQRGVLGVVPSWQLMRIDAFYAGQCGIGPFAMPPEDLWSNVIPALRLVREEVIPTVGQVEVRSSWRSPEANACARGAARSKHLQFSALDLVTADRQQGEDLYRELCAMHAAAGRASNMGLGAYFDFADEQFGGGRFHIDGEGYRTWGRGYTAAASPCRRFN